MGTHNQAFSVVTRSVSQVDPTSAKEMLLLAPSPDDQRRWVAQLRLRVDACGYAASSSSNSPSTSRLRKFPSSASSASNTSTGSASAPGGKASTLPSRKI